MNLKKDLRFGSKTGRQERWPLERARLINRHNATLEREKEDGAKRAEQRFFEGKRIGAENAMTMFAESIGLVESVMDYAARELGMALSKSLITDIERMNKMAATQDRIIRDRLSHVTLRASVSQQKSDDLAVIFHLDLPPQRHSFCLPVY